MLHQWTSSPPVLGGYMYMLLNHYYVLFLMTIDLRLLVTYMVSLTLLFTLYSLFKIDSTKQYLTYDIYLYKHILFSPNYNILLSMRTVHMCWFGLWSLTPLSTILQLYRGGQFSTLITNIVVLLRSMMSCHHLNYWYCTSLVI